MKFLSFIRTTSVFLIALHSPLVAQASEEYKTVLYTYEGLPIPKNQNVKIKTLVNTAFAVGYSEDLKNPLWCCYRLGNLKQYDPKVKVDATQQEKDLIEMVKDSSAPNSWERPRRFEIDHRTTSKVKHDDYTSSGYDRGHLAPNSAIGKHYGQMAVLETYFMTNIMPQTKKLNSGPWQAMEQYAREIVSQDDTKDKEIHGVHVITGPIFDQDNLKYIGNTGVAIPSHCYKIFAYRIGYFGTVKAVAFIMPQNINESGNKFEDYYKKYLTSVRKIEEKTGLNFFPDLTTRRQNNLEKPILDFEFKPVAP